MVLCEGTVDIEPMFDLDDGSILDDLVVGGSDVHIDDRLESFCDDDDDDDDICLASATKKDDLVFVRLMAMCVCVCDGYSEEERSSIMVYGGERKRMGRR